MRIDLEIVVERKFLVSNDDGMNVVVLGDDRYRFLMDWRILDWKSLDDDALWEVDTVKYSTLVQNSIIFYFVRNRVMLRNRDHLFLVAKYISETRVSIFL